MPETTIQLWADSLGKGVVFDEARGRYVITRERFAATLPDALGLPIENHSRMGAVVTDGLSGFLESTSNPGDIVVIAYGGNDCDMPWDAVSNTPEQNHDARTPLSLFEKTLQSFVAAARERDLRPLLITPPPLHAPRYFDWVSKTLNKDAILRFLGDVWHIYRWQERYSIAIRNVASQLKCPLLDIRDAFLADLHYPELFCIDGIHPNAEGHALITRAVLEHRGELAVALA